MTRICARAPPRSRCAQGHGGRRDDAVRSTARSPIRPDYRDQGVTFPDPLGENIKEIYAGLDIVNVEKNTLASRLARSRS